MENLDLLGIDKIRGDCLDRVPEEMPKLKYLDLRQCNKVINYIHYIYTSYKVKSLDC